MKCQSGLGSDSAMSRDVRMSDRCIKYVLHILMGMCMLHIPSGIVHQVCCICQIVVYLAIRYMLQP